MKAQIVLQGQSVKVKSRECDLWNGGIFIESEMAKYKSAYSAEVVLFPVLTEEQTKDLQLADYLGGSDLKPLLVKRFFISKNDMEQLREYEGEVTLDFDAPNMFGDVYALFS